jgi:hypothetical protein
MPWWLAYKEVYSASCSGVPLRCLYAIYLCNELSPESPISVDNFCSIPALRLHGPGLVNALSLSSPRPRLNPTLITDSCYFGPGRNLYLLAGHVNIVTQSWPWCMQAGLMRVNLEIFGIGSH